MLATKKLKMAKQEEKTGFHDSYEILESCKTYEEYLLKFAIRCIDEEFCYTEEQFLRIRKLYEEFFCKLAK